MSDDTDLDALTLSAPHLEAEPLFGDGGWVLRLSDGEQVVEISAEIGGQSAAADALDALAVAAGQTAEQLRRSGLARLRRP